MMENFTSDDRKALNGFPEFQRFARWLETKITGTERKILNADPKDTEALISYQAQRQAYKTILYAKENE